ncbi:MAG: amidohydrolase, partial [Deltaproteobacteria bacterium]|nr:amidohydrolase [Deltaproteobacteria bacterium]
MNKLDRQISQIKDELLNLRHELHRAPELGFKEFKTAAKVADYLKKLGLEVQTGAGGTTGVVGLLRGPNPGPTFGIRACLDALAIEEDSGLPFGSEIPGCMHGCGHDGNMTITLGAAKVLAQLKDELPGNVKFIFQPAEEDTGGSPKMVAAGVLKNPDVDVIVTPHNWPRLEQGKIALVPGPSMASSDIFQLEVIGVAGHGAWPHQSVDPIVLAAQVVLGLQTIVSRNLDPMVPAIVAIGRIAGGAATNNVPESVKLEGTVRTYDAKARDLIQRRIEEIAKGIAAAGGGSCKLAYQRMMPPLINNQEFVAWATATLNKTVGAGVVTNELELSLGCEEFSVFSDLIPGIFMYFGNDAPGDDFPLHAPNYKFNDAIIPLGVKA